MDQNISRFTEIVCPVADGENRRQTGRAEHGILGQGVLRRKKNSQNERPRRIAPGVGGDLVDLRLFDARLACYILHCKTHPCAT